MKSEPKSENLIFQIANLNPSDNLPEQINLKSVIKAITMSMQIITDNLVV